MMIIIIYTVFVFAIQRALKRLTLLRNYSSYRLAFTLGISLGIIHLLLAFPENFSILLLLEIFAGSFLGGLFATTLDNGILENTFPPPVKITDEVRKKHLEIIGKPPDEPVSKRFFDITLALTGLILSAPAWVIISFLIWLENPAPVFFIKNSVGKGGTNFKLIKFRSMICGAEEDTGPTPAKSKDPRVLRVGRFLRKTGLDELPQLINILKGEMSFVGPRPLRTIEVNGYLKNLPEFAKRHKVLPGVAGLSQVTVGYYVTPEERLAYDKEYIRHQSFFYDLKLFLRSTLIRLYDPKGLFPE